MMRRTRPALWLVWLASSVGAVACGETRLPLGDECLRSADCLSGVCSSRICVAAPTLVNGAVETPPDEEPRIPIVDGGAPADAGDGG